VQKEGYRARVFHPEDVERLREERRQALTRAVPFENEQRVLVSCPNGSCDKSSGVRSKSALCIASDTG
jgi:hypothetical protein